MPGICIIFANIRNEDMKKLLLLIILTAGLAAPGLMLAENNGARLELIDKELDLGSFHAVTPQRGMIRYRNAGDEPLVLTRVTGDCGCTVVKYSDEPLPPDSVGTISVHFNGKGRHPGKFRKMIRIRSNSTTGTEAAFVSGEIKRSLVK